MPQTNNRPGDGIPGPISSQSLAGSGRSVSQILPLNTGHRADGATQASNDADEWWAAALLAHRQLDRIGRGIVGEPPAPAYVGAVYAAAQRSKIIEAVGCRVGRNGRLLRVWWGSSGAE